MLRFHSCVFFGHSWGHTKENALTLVLAFESYRLCCSLTKVLCSRPHTRSRSCATRTQNLGQRTNMHGLTQMTRMRASAFSYRVKTLMTFSKLGRNSWVDPIVGICIFLTVKFCIVVSKKMLYPKRVANNNS